MDFAFGKTHIVAAHELLGGVCDLAHADGDGLNRQVRDIGNIADFQTDSAVIGAVDRQARCS
ncbi:hypothetical protein D3C78_1937670 [compost metagenome]